MAGSGIGRIPEFDPSLETFGTYTRRVEQYFIANGVEEKEDVRRRAIFLSAVGVNTFSLLEDLIAPATVSSVSFKDIVQILLEHFEPEQSSIAARYQFNRAVRDQGESVSAFVARLRHLAKPCRFLSVTTDEMLRDRFVCGLRNEPVQAKLLREANLSLASAIQIAQLSESAVADASQFSGAASATFGGGAGDDVIGYLGRGRGGRGRGPLRGAGVGQLRGPHSVSTTGVSASTTMGVSRGRWQDRGVFVSSRGSTRRLLDQRQCRRCLRQHADFECPARQLRCYRCHAIGHLRVACALNGTPRVQHLSDPEMEGAGVWDDDGLGGTGLRDPVPGASTVSGGVTQHIEPDPVDMFRGMAAGGENVSCRGMESNVEYADVDKGDEYFLFRSQGTGMSEKRPPMYVDVCVNDTPVRLELDTGAALSVCSEEEYRRIWPEQGPMIQPCNKSLRTYSGEQLGIKGQAEVQVKYGDQTADLSLIILHGSGPFLFGRDWLAKLRLNWPEICHVSTDASIDEIVNEYADVFSSELGRYTGEAVCIAVDPEVQPRFFKPRPVPLAYRETVERQLQTEIDQGLWETVRASKWAAPLVLAPKSDGSVRICGDYRLTVNKAAPVEQYPLPRFEELATKLQGSTVFSKVDLKAAYNQLTLDESSREYLTVNTSKGLLKPTRLGFGYSSAPALFQRTMETLLVGIPGTAVFLDDVVCSGKTLRKHNIALREVLDRVRAAGLKLNKGKCVFGASKVTYLGHQISGQGIEPTDDKVRAITEAPEPRNLSELRCWLGLINFYGKFLHGLASVLAPLYALLRKDVVWRWTNEELRAFQNAKKLLQSPPVLAHFDPDLPIVLACDASPVGIGCVLSQRTPSGERPIAFFSRTLNETERRYSQTDREGLAVVAGVKHFHFYLAGKTFVIQTDHKPLLGLIGEQKPLPVMASPRVVRWALMLGSYDYHLQYIPGTKQVHCDALSRLPIPADQKVSPIPAETVHLMEFLTESPVSVDQIRSGTARDPVLSRVLQFVRDGWPQSTVSLGPDFQPFKSREAELSIQDGCILWGARVVVPPQARAQVLKMLHEGHKGESRTKSFARMYVWWPYLDEHIVSMTKQCDVCQEHRAGAPETPIHPWVWPSRPWERVHLDHAGPMSGWMFLVIVDAHSKWMDIYPTRSTGTDATLELLRQSFACWGLPRTIVTDNAQGFMSEEFKLFCKKNNITHLTTPAMSPKSNGLAEKCVGTFKSSFKKQRSGSVHTRVSRFLFSYRSTPHTTTRMSPAEMFLGRRVRTPIDALVPDLSGSIRQHQTRQKLYRDRHTVDRDVNVGDSVYVSAVSRLRGGEGRTWLPGVLVGKAGVKLWVRLKDGRIIDRHLDHVRAVSRCPPVRCPPVRRRDTDPPSAGYPRELVTSQCTAARAQQPAAVTSPPATVTAAAAAGGVRGEPRYDLRNRAVLRQPDRLAYE